MGYYIGDMVNEHLAYNNTKDIFYYCQRGLAEALAREDTIKKLGLEEVERILYEDEWAEKLYDMEQPAVEEYEKKIEEFVDSLSRSEGE